VIVHDRQAHQECFNILKKEHVKEAVFHCFSGDLEVARKAIDQNTGARGLRRIIEELMLDLMYDIPSDENIGKVIIHERCVDKKEPYQIIYKLETQIA